MFNINPGSPHFSGIVKQCRSASYNFDMIINEFIDNIIKKCSEIQIRAIIEPESDKLYELIISDNYDKGFESILESGTANPFNTTHMRAGQSDDSETSEFGIGMKAAAICLGNKFTVITRINDKYIKVEFDFVEMMKEPDASKSFNPINVMEITEVEYLKKHIYKTGSTLIISSIRTNILSMIQTNNITNVIKNNIARTYSEIMKDKDIKISIKVNDIVISAEKTYFDDDKCKPFSKTTKIYCLKKYDEYIYYIKNSADNNKIYIPKDNKLEAISTNEIKRYITHGNYEHYGVINSKNNACIIIESTFTLFSDKFIGLNEDNIEEYDEMMPKNTVLIYKDNRRYTDYIQKSNSCKNFNVHRLKFKSKKIGKEIGITFNKKFSLNDDIDITNIIKLVITDNSESFSCDKKTMKYKELYMEAVQLGLINPKYNKPVAKESIKSNIKESFNDFIKTITKEPVKVVNEPVKESVKKIMEPIKEVKEVKETVKKIMEPIKEVKEPVKKIIEPIKEVKELIKEPIKEPIKELVKEPVKELCQERNNYFYILDIGENNIRIGYSKNIYVEYDNKFKIHMILNIKNIKLFEERVKQNLINFKYNCDNDYYEVNINTMMKQIMNII